MRQVIERAFALLKGRWRRLKFLDMKRDDMIPFVILACCVLHNICFDNGLENYEDFIIEGHDDDDNDDDNNNDHFIRRSETSKTILRIY